MQKFLQILLDEWADRKGSAIITTVDASGNPNSIYATFVSIWNNGKILVANNYFHKTLNNVKNGCKGNVLFLSNSDKAYQIPTANILMI